MNLLFMRLLQDRNPSINKNALQCRQTVDHQSPQPTAYAKAACASAARACLRDSLGKNSSYNEADTHLDLVGFDTEAFTAAGQGSPRCRQGRVPAHVTSIAGFMLKWTCCRVQWTKCFFVTNAAPCCKATCV